MPDYEGLNLEYYLDAQKPYSAWVFNTYHDDPRAMPIVISRACPFKCTFCYQVISKYRSRPMDKVFEELEYLVKRYNINSLSIYDDLFAVKREQVEEFCRRIKPMNLLWGCQLRVNLVNDELLAMMRDAGCISISYGFESFSESVLISMKKKIQKEQIAAAAYNTYKNKMDVVGNFICGDPAETYDTINETLTWWKRHPEYAINLNTVQTYPGAQIYHVAVSKGLIADKVDYLRKGCPDVNLTGIPDAEWRDFAIISAMAATAMRVPAQILSLHPVSAGEERRMGVSVVCPHCGQTVQYGNLPIGNLRVMCKSCYARMDIPFQRFLGRANLPEANVPALTQALDLLSRAASTPDPALRRQSLQMALQAAESVWTPDSPDIDAAHIAGTILLVANRLPQAIEALHRAINLAPDDERIHNNLAVAYLSMGSVGWGILHLDYALRLNPAFGEALDNRAATRTVVADGSPIPFVPLDNPACRSLPLRLALPGLSRQAGIPAVPPLRPHLMAAAQAAE
jgi:tetratricopeptide (TPR) repeat protein